MATQAGWYNAPGEPGTFRYWSGDAWTDHRQPAPTAPAPASPASTSPVPISPAPGAAAGSTTTSDAAMQPFEQQFVAEPMLQLPVFQQAAVPTGTNPPQPTPAPGPTQSPDAVRPDPYADHSSSTHRDREASNPGWSDDHAYGGGQRQPVVTTGVHLGFNIDGIPVGPGALSGLQDFSEVSSQLHSAMRDARSRAATQPRSTALKGAVKGMIVGLVIIILGAAIMLFFSSQDTVGPGEAAIQGTVSDTAGIGSACRPVVTFTVGSQTYGAGQGIGGSCTSDIVGEDVDVIYNVDNPGQGARYDFGSPVESFDVLIPLFGLVVLVSGLGTFIVRLVRRRSGVAANTDGP